MPRGTSLYDEMWLQRRLEPEAQDYIERVQRAEGQATESAVRVAINAFVAGCKDDGTWGAIKACCILAGARTLIGALVPLVGAAPTSNNFVAADYNRRTGLVGNGTSKSLNSNRNNNADPQNSRHAAVHANTPDNTGRYLIGARTPGTDSGSTQLMQSTQSASVNSADASDNAGAAMPTNTPTFKGISRSSSSNYISRVNGTNFTITRTSATPVSQSLMIFNRQDLPGSTYSNARIAFYSIGEALDLALFDARVSELMRRIETAAA